MNAVFCWTTTAFAGAPRQLSFPEPAQALETLQRSVAAVGVDADRLIIMPREGGFAIVTPFHPKAATREQVFGKITDSTRQEVAKDDGPFSWASVFVRSGRIMLLDGQSLALIEADAKTFKEIVRRSIPWDTILPPRDRGGEATGPETAALRASFKRAFLGTLGPKITGMAAVPDSWHTGKKQQYLAATRIKGFPLLLVECDREEASSCVVARQCYLEGASDLLSDSITGIVLNDRKRQIWLGDRKAMRLDGFKYHSCFHVTRRNDLQLPDRLKTMTNIALDADDRLFLTTEIPDDYYNASLFFWPKASWLD